MTGIVVLVSGLDGAGGVQRHDRLMCRSLAALAQEHSLALDIISLHDRPNWRPSFPNASFTAYGGAIPRFAMRAAWRLSRPWSAAFIGHVDLGPTVLPFLLAPWTGHVVASTHGVEVWGKLPWLKAFALRKATRVWTVSNFTAAALVDLQGVERERIGIVPNVLDPTFSFGRSIRRDGPHSPTRLLSVARLSRADRLKGMDSLLAAMPEIHRRLGSVELTVIGDGDDRGRLEQLARTVGADDFTTFAGVVSDQSLNEAYLSSDIFVLPSAKEGFGLAHVEAMACGLPVVGANTGGTPEIVTHGITGCLVDYGNERQIAEAVSTIASDPSLWRAMSQAARMRANAFNYGVMEKIIAEEVSIVLPDLQESEGNFG